MQDDKNRVETILFTTGGFLGLEDISRLTDISDFEHLRNVIKGLVEDYSKRDSALEIIHQGDKWKLSIRKGYLHLTEKLLKDSDLDRPSQETLAVIAYKNPALQCDVIKIRGNKAYDHINNLKALDFITADKFGRTRMLKVTQKFYDYFDVVAEQLKSKFEGAIPEQYRDKIDKIDSTEEIKKEIELEKLNGGNEESSQKEISTEAFNSSEKAVKEKVIDIAPNILEVNTENKKDAQE